MHPVFARVVGELGAADPSMCSMKQMKPMIVQVQNVKFMDEAESQGTSTWTTKPRHSAQAKSTQGVFL